jgi:hypothetical protein
MSLTRLPENRLIPELQVVVQRESTNGNPGKDSVSAKTNRAIYDMPTRESVPKPNIMEIISSVKSQNGKPLHTPAYISVSFLFLF